MTDQGESGSLFRHRDFMLLWTGQSISEIGSSVTLIALPLTAVVILHATTLQVGLLTAASTISFLLVALPAGLVVDRVAKRGLMIACDVFRMLIIGSVALAALFKVLTMAQLFAVALLAGLATVFFDVAYQSYVPYLVHRERLHDANGKLGATQAFAQVAGLGLGGGLFGLLKAGAMTVDALSYAVSFVTMLLIKTREPRPARARRSARRRHSARARRSGRAQSPPAEAQPERLPVRKEILAGLAFVVGHPVLRKIAACTGTANLFGQMAAALEIIFLVRVLHVPAADTGLLVAVGSLGGILGGVLSGRLSRWIGSARIIWFSMLVFGAVAIVMPLSEPGWRLVFFPISVASLSFTAVVYNVAQLSYRQLICPPELLGRMNAAIRWIVWGTLPLGGLLGGVLGSASVIGIRPTIWVGVIGSWAACFWVVFSPLRTMRDIPKHAGPSAAPESPDDEILVPA
jgi:MFS family permease